jgi:hypothetical protein
MSVSITGPVAMTIDNPRIGALRLLHAQSTVGRQHLTGYGLCPL